MGSVQCPVCSSHREQLKHKSANREDGTHLDIVVDDFFDVQVLTLLHKAISTYPYS